MKYGYGQNDSRILFYSVNYEYLQERIGSIFVISINKAKVSTNF